MMRGLALGGLLEILALIAIYMVIHPLDPTYGVLDVLAGAVTGRG
jgi:hypothetical protein